MINLYDINTGLKIGDGIVAEAYFEDERIHPSSAGQNIVALIANDGVVEAVAGRVDVADA